MRSPILLSIAVAGMFGCAGVQIPPEQLEKPSADIRAAEEMGASNVPAARLHLQLARDEATWARKLALAGDERAEMELARAAADAELALDLAKEASVHEAAMAAGEELRATETRGHPQ